MNPDYKEYVPLAGPSAQIKAQMYDLKAQMYGVRFEQYQTNLRALSVLNAELIKTKNPFKVWRLKKAKKELETLVISQVKKLNETLDDTLDF